VKSTELPAAAVRCGSSPTGCETGGDRRIDAKSETITNWGMFQEAFADRRCLVRRRSVTSGATIPMASRRSLRGPDDCREALTVRHRGPARSHGVVALFPPCRLTSPNTQLRRPELGMAPFPAQALRDRSIATPVTLYLDGRRSPAGERLQTFATITTDANELLAPIQR
jgi:hypothetical protein